MIIYKQISPTIWIRNRIEQRIKAKTNYHYTKRRMWKNATKIANKWQYLCTIIETLEGIK